MTEAINLLVDEDEVAPLSPIEVRKVLEGETVCYHRKYSDEVKIYFRNYGMIYEYILPERDMIHNAHIIGKVDHYEI